MKELLKWSFESFEGDISVYRCHYCGLLPELTVSKINSIVPGMEDNFDKKYINVEIFCGSDDCFISHKNKCSILKYIGLNGVPFITVISMLRDQWNYVNFNEAQLVSLEAQNAFNYMRDGFFGLHEE